MIENKLFVESFVPADIDVREALRYAGVRGKSEDARRLLLECSSELCGKIKTTVVYKILPFRVCEGEVDFGFASVRSSDLEKRLNGAGRVVFCAMTIGLEVDRLIAKYERISAAKALIMSALGSERAEALADAFCDELSKRFKKEGCSLTARFSAGYGDLPIEFQRDIFNQLTPEKYIGLTLGDSFMMSPVKSVTAIMGVIGNGVS